MLPGVEVRTLVERTQISELLVIQTLRSANGKFMSTQNGNLRPLRRASMPAF
jgi:hypothetical protein